MFISEAIAQTGAAPQESWLMGYMPLILIFLVFYFLFLRPQNKRMTEHTNMLSTLRRGDKIVTAGGLCAEISKVEDDKLKVIIADGVEITITKTSVADLEQKASEQSSKHDKSSKKGKNK